MLFVIVALLIGAALTGWGYSRRQAPPAFDSRLMVAFALRPGERPVRPWPALDPQRRPVWVTLTTERVLAIGHPEEGNLARLAPGQVVVARGASGPPLDASAEASIELRLRAASGEDMWIAVPASAATTIEEWARA